MYFILSFQRRAKIHKTLATPHRSRHNSPKNDLQLVLQHLLLVFRATRHYAEGIKFFILEFFRV